MVAAAMECSIIVFILGLSCVGPGVGKEGMAGRGQGTVRHQRNGGRPLSTSGIEGEMLNRAVMQEGGTPIVQCDSAMR